jgi:hypothetical protein
MSEKIEEVQNKDEESTEEKHVEVYFSFGGATSLQGALQYLEARETQRKANDLTWMYRQIVDNILRGEMDLPEKTAAIKAATTELADLLEEVQSKSLVVRIKDALFSFKQAAFDTSAWSGAASNWPSTAAYCASCLIDVNPPGSDKRQTHCMLPLKKSGSAKPNRNALRTMATGRGISAVKKPAGVDAGKWAAAKKRAAGRIASLWPKAFNTPAPAGVLSAAGRSAPKSKGIELYRTKDSPQLKWRAIVSNNFRDREGEIITRKAQMVFW